MAQAEQSSAVSAWRRQGFNLLLLAMLCLACAPFFAPTVAPDPFLARNGIIAVDPARLDRPVELAGEWAFEWITPAGPGLGGVGKIAVPGGWAGKAHITGQAFPDQGRAVYRATLTGLPAGQYRLYVPVIYAANSVRIDGRTVSSWGRLGAGAAETRYEWRSHDLFFEARGAPVTVEIEMAAFLHRDTGMETPPVLGRLKPMQTMFSQSWALELLAQVPFILLAFFGITLFLLRRSDKASFYFGLFCLFFNPVVALLGFDNMIAVLFPAMPFPLMLGIVYIATGVGLACFLAYAHTLFPAESPRPAYLALQGLILLFFGAELATLLFSGTLLASRLNTWLFVVFLTVFPYIIFVLVRAAWRGRDGAFPFLIGMTAMAGSAIGLQFVASGLISMEQAKGIDFATYGVLIMLFSHLIVLGERWSSAITTTERSNDELRQLLEVNSSIASEVELGTLLRRIVEVTSRILHAERSTLFLHDPERGDLWSLVAEGVDTKEIRIAADQGLAGSAFSSGETVVAADAYHDARFNPAIDAQTGFVTRSVLAMPIVARDGRRLGVMQALNRKGGGGFSEADVARMSAFVAQAAISIDNATLFSEVVSARNYNESILGSMSSGVVTIDAAGKIAKLNDAALRIFRVEAAAMVGVDAHDLLARRNGWLNEEIDAVRADGQARSRLDTDLVANDGSPISANVAIVPLTGDGEAIGVLVIVEDISEGKRLEGTMRRFMPQEVVKEVLGRGEDLLFGSAIPASVLFADIRSFTTIAESLSARETVDMLNEIFTDLFEAVASTDGMIDKYMGDAVMAVYGAPLPGGQDAVNAVGGAIEMMRMIAALNKTRASRGQAALRLGAGIASGEVVAGTIGSPKRMDYTVIGDTVNLAARLQDATKMYQVNAIVCEGTAAKVAGRHVLRDLDTIRVRGRSRPTRIFEIVAAGGTSAALVEAYARGRAATEAHDWRAALEAFEAAIAMAPGDRASLLMRDRVRGALADPPPRDWDGVWQ